MVNNVIKPETCLEVGVIAKITTNITGYLIGITGYSNMVRKFWMYGNKGIIKYLQRAI